MREYEFFESRIKIYEGDITMSHCEAIVNAANKSLLGGGGVDGAIHASAGPKLLEECRKLRGCNTGEAKITGGYNLFAKYVIHTVGPIYSGSPKDEAELENCYRNSMELARANNIKSIAFPGISTGVYGYPKAEATEIAINTVLKWIRENADYKIDIEFVSFSKEAYHLYCEFMDTLI